MAPEQAEDPHKVDTRADIYSFGATFYHALTGQRPFDGETPFAILYKHKTEPLAPPQNCNPRLSTRTSQIIERCLAKSPGDRFSRFADVLAQLSADELRDASTADDDPRLASMLATYLSRRDSVYLSRWDGLFRVEQGTREVDSFQFPAGQQLRIMHGNILTQEVDAIVNSTDDNISMNTGLAQAVGLAGGPNLRQQAEELAPVRPGRAVVTTAGNLPSRLVIHAVTVGIYDNRWILPSRGLITDLVSSCLYQADSHRVESIAFPLFATGAMSFAEDECLDTMFRSIARALLHGLTSVRDVRIIIFNEEPAAQAEVFVRMVFEPIAISDEEQAVNQ
jgi:O-acetyl-ADP-ribose deacetylase (regulator of RNase III)